MRRWQVGVENEELSVWLLQQIRERNLSVGFVLSECEERKDWQCITDKQWEVRGEMTMVCDWHFSKDIDQQNTNPSNSAGFVSNNSPCEVTNQFPLRITPLMPALPTSYSSNPGVFLFRRHGPLVSRNQWSCVMLTCADPQMSTTCLSTSRDTLE